MGGVYRIVTFYHVAPYFRDRLYLRTPCNFVGRCDFLGIRAASVFRSMYSALPRLLFVGACIPYVCASCLRRSFYVGISCVSTSSLACPFWVRSLHSVLPRLYPIFPPSNDSDSAYVVIAPRDCSPCFVFVGPARGVAPGSSLPTSNTMAGKSKLSTSFSISGKPQFVFLARGRADFCKSQVADRPLSLATLCCWAKFGLERDPPRRRTCGGSGIRHISTLRHHFHCPRSLICVISLSLLRILQDRRYHMCI